MAKRKATNFIAIHCSATRPSMDIGVPEIDKWHKAKGWAAGCGYHYVIKRDGTLQTGRREDEIGAHVQGYNAESIGVCMVGGVSEDDFRKAENNFTPKQFAALKGLLHLLKTKYPQAKIQGHRDFPNVKKACPSFSVAAWLKTMGL